MPSYARRRSSRRTVRATRVTRRVAPRTRSYRGRRMRRSSMPRTVSLVQPRAQYVRIKYFKSVDVDSGANPFYAITYRGNGAYDPEYAVGGGQPSGFVNWAGFYNRYKVLSSRIHVRATGNATGKQYMVGVHARLDSASPPGSGIAAQQTLSELGDSRYVVLDDRAYAGARSYGSFTMSRSSRRMFNNTVVTDQDLTSPINTTPSRQWHYDVIVCSPNATSTGLTVTYQITITYLVKFFEPIVPYTD